MATRLHDQKEDLLSGAIARLHDKLDKRQAKLGEAFLRHYYRSVAPVDLVDRDALDLYGAALAHLRFGERREAGKAKVRVYNPQIEQHGWQSTHTTIEIITDDMPFLVDSVTMAINRLGLIIHLVIHPVLPVTRGDDQALTSIGAPDSNGGGGSCRELHACRGGSSERSSAPRRDPGGSWSERSPMCAPPSKIGNRSLARSMRRSRTWTVVRKSSRPMILPKRALFWNGSPTTISRSSATAATTW